VIGPCICLQSACKEPGTVRRHLSASSLPAACSRCADDATPVSASRMAFSVETVSSPSICGMAQQGACKAGCSLGGSGSLGNLTGGQGDSIAMT